MRDRLAVRHLVAAVWNEERFLVRFWTAFSILLLIALLIEWLLSIWLRITRR